MKFEKSVITACCLLAIAATPALAVGNAEMPKNAKPGECYARVFVPATYKTTTETVLKKEASEDIQVVPARYEWAEERVLVKEAGERLEQVPARYEWAEERILVKPAQTVWKEGNGPIEKVDNATGEILCLVEEPAVYKTVKKRVLKSPATTRTVEIPAEYKTVRVQRLVSGPSKRSVDIPAEYETVSKRELVTDSGVQWKSVLCQTNMSRDVVTSIQRALSNAGHNPGPIDGQIGSQTMAALKSFQRARGLSQGALTMDTLNALKVRIGG